MSDDFLIAVLRAKRERQAALAQVLGAVVPEPEQVEPEPDPMPVVSFDGGARRSPPLAPPSHGEWLMKAIRGEIPRDAGP
jgi:hypothetical protein